MKPEAQLTQLDQQELETLLAKIEATMGEETARPFVFYWDGAYRC